MRYTEFKYKMFRYCIPYQHIVGAIVSCNESKELLLKSGFCKRIKIDPDIFFDEGGEYSENIDRKYL